ncbi:MAG: amino acid permease [Candidatus Hydrogenedentes bacterium]|nr:amino acid permease [Candidatus Hydrogenedentota bacterium]
MFHGRSERRLRHGSTEVTGRPAALRRDMGLLDATGVGLGAIIGAGLLVVTGVAAGVAGPALLLSLLLAAAAAACNALSSAQLAARYPRSGGTYEYGYLLLNPWLGFAAGWMFLVSKLAAGGVVALGFAEYLAALAPGIPARPAAVGAVLVLTVLNYFGIRRTGRVNLVIVTVSLAALLYFVAAGLPSLQIGHFTPFAPEGGEGILRAAALLFFAYTGYARVATLGEDVHDPERTIPRAILASLGIATLLYVSVATVALGAVGAPALARTGSPLEEAAASFGVLGAGLAIAVGGVSAMLGVLLSQILGISRAMLAMARRSDLPPFLGHVDSRHAVPGRDVVLTGCLIAVLALTGPLERILSAASFSILVYYAITNMAALRLTGTDRRYPRVISVAGLFLCITLCLALEPGTILTGSVLVTAGFAYRGVFRWVRSRPADPSQ